MPAQKLILPWQPKPIDYNKIQGQGRHSNNQAFYKSPAWRKVRAQHLREHPFCQCEYCKQHGLTLQAEMVDHKKQINPHNAYDTLHGKYPHPLDKSNLQSMTNQHHNWKSAKEAHK